MHACILSHLSHVQLLATLWTVALQAPLSMGFSRQEYWRELPCRPPEHPPNPGTEPLSLMSPALAGRFFTTSATWEEEDVGTLLLSSRFCFDFPYFSIDVPFTFQDPIQEATLHFVVLSPASSGLWEFVNLPLVSMTLMVLRSMISCTMFLSPGFSDVSLRIGLGLSHSVFVGIYWENL